MLRETSTLLSRQLTRSRLLDDVPSHRGAEEVLRRFQSTMLSGAVRITTADESSAIEAMQRMPFSQWAASKKVLRAVAAEKGVDLESGEVIRPLLRNRHTSSKPSRILRHPAWDLEISQETREEKFHLTVLHDMTTLDAAEMLWTPSRSATLSTSYSLTRCVEISNDDTLRDCVLPWTTAAITGLLMRSCTNPTPPPSMTTNEWYRGQMGARLAALEKKHLRARREDPLSYVTTMCPLMDEMFVDQVARVLFAGGTSRPKSLERDRLTELFPRVCTRPSAGRTWSPQQRLQHILRRTLRADVSQGVLIPDSEFILSQFDRLVSLSQHREVLVPHHVLNRLVATASPDGADWKKYQARKALSMLLTSATTDRHAPPPSANNSSHKQARDDDHSYGGVTLLGVLDELTIMDAYATNHNTAANMLTEAARLAWGAKYIATCRYQLVTDVPCALDPVSVILAGFGLGHSGTRESRKAPAPVTVLSTNPDVHMQCTAIGVRVMA